MEDELVWSTDEETFSGDSKWDAIDNLLGEYTVDEAVGMTIYYGTFKKPLVSDFIDADWVLDTMADAACDEYGEWAENFAQFRKDIPADAKAVGLLENYLAKWANKYCPVDFYKVESVKKYVITEEDLEGYVEC